MEIQQQLSLVTTNNISEIKDNSDEMYNRMRVILKNGYEVSVISGQYAYCTPGISFEIAIYDKDGNFCPNLFDENDQGDDVLGHCPIIKVKEYIEKIGALKA